MDAETRRVIRSGDPLPDWARAAIGNACQLRLPMRDAIDARRQAEILRMLANRMEVLSHSKESTAAIMLQIQLEVRMTQQRLKSYPHADRNNRVA